MENNQKKNAYQMLVLITTHKLADKACAMFKKSHVSLIYRFNAQGTASSEIMDMLGLGSIDKCVLVSMISKEISTLMLKKLKKELKMEAVNSGIAFTMPLSGANGLLLHIAKKNAEALMGDTKDFHERYSMVMTENNHVLIAAIVNRGFSGDVMEAARGAGATGGTLIQSRRAGDEESAGFWGLGVQEEKEIVIILSEAESKVAIMQSISDRCGIKTEAKGLVLSLPIDSVTGI